MSIWEYTILFFSVVLGGGAGFYFQRSNRQLLSLILSFSGAYILGIAVLHLMPGVFHDPEHNRGRWILLGFFIQLFLEQLSGGVEHGHIHPHDHAPRRFALQVMVGLCFHAFIEGMPLGHYSAFHHTAHDGSDLTFNHLLFGIILHKAPASFALVVLFLLSGFRRRFIVFCMLFFAAMSPLGAYLADHLIDSENILSILMALVIGSFLHISTTILFESDERHHHAMPWKKLLVILAGLGLSLLTI